MTYQLLFLGSPILLAAVAQGLCIRYDWLAPIKKPLDLGLHLRGKRIFGDHKTWRGLAINVVCCTLGTLIQAWFQREDYLPRWLPFFDYEKHGPLIGLLLGLGMTVGELPNSFVKRQLEIAPGMRKKGFIGIVFFLFDQVDLTVGIWLFLFFVIRPSLVMILWSFAITIVSHVAVSSMGYFLGMRKTLV